MRARRVTPPDPGRFDTWAAQVIRRADLATSDWWKAEMARGNGSGLRLHAELAAALYQAASGQFNKEGV